MYRKSKSSGVVTIRLPNPVLYTISRRINGKRSRWDSVGEYIKERLIYDIMRSHRVSKSELDRGFPFEDG